MFDYIQGTLVSLESNFIVIDVHGIGYKIFVTETWLTELKTETSAAVKVFIILVVKETEQLLYGFKNKDLKNYFSMLISVPGIGPKIALSVLSLFSCKDIFNAVQQKNSVIFSSVSGIGRKTAEKLILDLEGKLPKISPLASEVTVSMTHFDDAVAALIQLGYSKSVAEQLLRNTLKKMPSDSDLPTILKEALRKY